MILKEYMINEINIGQNASPSSKNKGRFDKNLKIAKEMQKRGGYNNEEIRLATNWFVGLDGKWRYETMVDGLEINPEIINSIKNKKTKHKTHIRFSYFMPKNPYIKIYPELKDLTVTIHLSFDNFDHLGSFDRDMDEINLYIKLDKDNDGGNVFNEQQVMNTFIHELQHKIQDMEGFSGGSSPEFEKSKSNVLFPKLEDEIEFKENIKNFIENLNYRSFKKITDHIKNKGFKNEYELILLKPLNHYTGSDLSFDRKADRIFPNIQSIFHRKPKLYDEYVYFIYDMLSKPISEYGQYMFYEKYRQNFGELEANDAKKLNDNNYHKNLNKFMRKEMSRFLKGNELQNAIIQTNIESKLKEIPFENQSEYLSKTDKDKIVDDKIKQIQNYIESKIKTDMLVMGVYTFEKMFDFIKSNEFHNLSEGEQDEYMEKYHRLDKTIKKKPKYDKTMDFVNGFEGVLNRLNNLKK